MTQNIDLPLMSLLMLGCYVGVNSRGGWSGPQRLLQICSSAWPVFPWVGLVTMEELTLVGPPRRIVLVPLPFWWSLTVLLWCAMGPWSWLCKCILWIYVDSQWINSLLGIIPKSDKIMIFLKGKCPIRWCHLRSYAWGWYAASISWSDSMMCLGSEGFSRVISTKSARFSSSIFYL